MKFLFFALILLINVDQNLAISTEPLQWDQGDGKDFENYQLRNGDAKNFNILWWNMQEGKTSQRLTLEKKEDFPLENNLIKLGQQTAGPQVILLGEYNKDKKQETLWAAIRKLYPYQGFFPYNHSVPHLGIFVLSKVKFKLKELVELDWTPRNLSPEKQEEYRNAWPSSCHDASIIYYRSLPRLQFLLPEAKNQKKIVDVLPIHLSQPWDCMQEDATRLHVFYQLFLGNNSPLYYQVERLQHYLKSSYSTPDVMVGDFNVPDSLFALQSPMYQNLNEVMNDVVLNRDEITYPAYSAKNDFLLSYLIRGFRIDHAFTGKQTTLSLEARSIRLQGSDHYPLWINLK